MASTPIYNWPTPDNTGLVKNGALDMRTLGNAIDTTMGTMVAKTIVDAKGDLIAGTAADTTARLAVGANGETLVADSSTSTGLRYQAPKTQNAIYNSGFDIAQRGTSFTALSAVDYTLDRWVVWSTTGGQSNYASQQSAGNLSVSPNQAIRYCIRVGRTSGTTNTGARQLFQTLETNDSVRFAGQTVTFSFYARAGANYSQALSQLNYGLTQGTGTDQIYYSFTGASAVTSGVVTLTTSWQRFTFTGTVNTNSTQLAPYFSFSPTGTAGAADYFEITGVQLEVGSVATPYNRMSGTIQGELAACQRYYYQMTQQFGYLVSGTVNNSAETLFALACPTAFRVQPSISVSNVTHFALIPSNASVTSFNVVSSSGNTCAFYTAGSSGLTVGQSQTIFPGNAASQLRISAEL